MFLILLLAFLPLLSPTSAAPIAADDPTYLYKVTLVRATPGKLLDLIDMLKTHREHAATGSDAPPFLMRHSQGDQWDLFLLYPMESYASYYEPARITQRAEATEEMRGAWTDLVAWEEDLFAYGPALDVVQQHFADAGFFHIEMFKALPGMQETLIEEREMENRYLAQLNRPQTSSSSAIRVPLGIPLRWASTTTSSISPRAQTSRWRPKTPPPKPLGSRASMPFLSTCARSSRCTTTRLPIPFGDSSLVFSTGQVSYKAFPLRHAVLHLPHHLPETPLSGGLLNLLMPPSCKRKAGFDYEVCDPHSFIHTSTK